MEGCYYKMNILKFNGLVLEKMGFTYTFFRLSANGWVLAVQKGEKIIASTVLTADDIQKRFNLDMSKFV